VLDSLERAECEALILKHGGKVAKSVTKALTYAVIGTEPGASKMKSLDERPDVKRLDEDGLFELIRSAAISPEQAKKIAADKEKAAAKKQKEFEAEAARMAAQMAATNTAATAVAAKPVKPLDPLQEAALAAQRAAEEAARRKLAPQQQPPTTTTTTTVIAAASTPARVLPPSITASTPSSTTATTLKSPPPSNVTPPKSAMAGSRAAASLVSASTTSTAATTTTSAVAKSSTPAAPTSLLWVDLFRPKSADDLIGNPGIHTTLLSWLRSWNPKSTEKRAVLLSGAPGIGKSSAAHILAREAGYVPIEFNASDTRNQKSVLLTVGEMVSTHGMSEFTGRTTAASTLKSGDKPCVIMDEVDGMSAGDRGGTTALIALIKKTLVPIICICNDRQSTKVRSLRNYCKELQYKKPMWSQASTRLMVIAKLRNLHVDAATMERIFTACNGDIRQTLTMLQMWSDGSGTKLAAATPRAVGQSAKAPVDDQLAAQLASTAKEATLGPFEALRRLFEPVAMPTPNNRREFDHALDLFWNDRDMMPLFVHENYPRQQPDLFRSQTSRMARRQLGSLAGKSELAHLELLAMTAESLSTGAAVEAVLRRTQDYSLANLAGALSCAVPAALLRSATASNGMIDFPSYLGQFSKARKANRLAGELHSRMRSTISATLDDVALDYVPALIGPLTQPLITRGREGIPQVIELMDEYGLMRDDWDSVCDLRFIESDNDPRKQIESTVKSAFTRTYNASAHAVRAVGATGTKRSAADVHILADEEAGDDNDDNDGAAGGDGDASDDDANDDDDDNDKAVDLKDDALIKRKEAPKKRKAAAGGDGESASSSKSKRGRAKK
jgi:replication factor C subunit 1